MCAVHILTFSCSVFDHLWKSRNMNDASSITLKTKKKTIFAFKPHGAQEDKSLQTPSQRHGNGLVEETHLCCNTGT